MNQSERRVYLIRKLMDENSQYKNIQIYKNKEDQKRLLRALFNVRMPAEADTEFLNVQDEYLQEAIRRKGITDVEDLTPVEEGIYIWQGDITTLRADAVVNAANSGMTGCYVPNHNCIDNAIHTYAGVELRLACDKIMRAQGHEEPTGQAKITPAFNLPAEYVIHTVGPIVQGYDPSETDRKLLDSCYESCLALAAENGCKSISFCCISTGIFGYPPEKAAREAVRVVRSYLKEHPDGPVKKVIFNVFKDSDLEIYENLLK